VSALTIGSSNFVSVMDVITLWVHPVVDRVESNSAINGDILRLSPLEGNHALPPNKRHPLRYAVLGA